MTVQQSGLLNHLTAVDLVLADKGFLILDLVPNGVLVNILMMMMMSLNLPPPRTPLEMSPFSKQWDIH